MVKLQLVHAINVHTTNTVVEVWSVINHLYWHSTLLIQRSVIHLKVLMKGSGLEKCATCFSCWTDLDISLITNFPWKSNWTFKMCFIHYFLFLSWILYYKNDVNLKWISGITLKLSVQLAKLFTLLVFAHDMKKGEWLMLPLRILVLRFVKDVIKFFFCTPEPEMSVLGIPWMRQLHSFI